MSESYILSMWIRFLLAPSESKPADDGSFFIGEIGEVATRNWTKTTPYSPAIKLAGIKFENEVPRLAFVNELETPNEQPAFW